MNLAAVEDMEARFPDGDVVLIESGGDNLTLTFSPALVDFFIYVIDVAAGDKIPRKNGPGITQSDILVINKTDLAPHVGASLAVMEHDSRMMRGDKPFLFTNCKTGEGIPALVELIRNDPPFDLVAGRSLRNGRTRTDTVPGAVAATEALGASAAELAAFQTNPQMKSGRSARTPSCIWASSGAAGVRSWLTWTTGCRTGRSAPCIATRHAGPGLYS